MLETTRPRSPPDASLRRGSSLVELNSQLSGCASRQVSKPSRAYYVLWGTNCACSGLLHFQRDGAARGERTSQTCGFPKMARRVPVDLFPVFYMRGSKNGQSRPDFILKVVLYSLNNNMFLSDHPGNKCRTHYITSDLI